MRVPLFPSCREQTAAAACAECPITAEPPLSATLSRLATFAYSALPPLGTQSGYREQSLPTWKLCTQQRVIQQTPSVHRELQILTGTDYETLLIRDSQTCAAAAPRVRLSLCALLTPFEHSGSLSFIQSLLQFNSLVCVEMNSRA